jgi:hypothetical protein
MAQFGIAAIIAVFFVVAIGAWVFSMSMDKDRITAYIQDKGGRIVSISWAPFGTGWFGSKNERIYEVVYYDSQGDQHWATCKTSLFFGVYWTDDRVSHRKAGWYDGLPKKNEPHDPIIRHIPRPHEKERIENDAAKASGGASSERSDDSVDEEIARLHSQIAELQQKKRLKGT